MIAMDFQNNLKAFLIGFHVCEIRYSLKENVLKHNLKTSFWKQDKFPHCESTFF